MCKFFGKDLSFEREKEVELLLPNYTKCSGMSCGGIWTMMGHGREKGGVLEKINKMVIFRENRF